MAGFLCLAWLIRNGRHRDGNGRAARAKMAGAVLQGAGIYTIALTIGGNWVLKLPVSETISRHFGEERFCWLLLGIAIDQLWSLLLLFDRDP